MDFAIFIGILLILGLISTRVVKVFKLPNVTGFLVIGFIAAFMCILIDKYSNQTLLLSTSLNKFNSIVSTISLGFIALAIGEEFTFKKLKLYGKKILVITLLQALLATFFVDAVVIVICVLLKVNIAIAIVLGAIATATAPAATIMVIHQYKAKGELVDVLLPVVAFDDAIGLIVFSISLSIAKLFMTSEKISAIAVIAIPILNIIISLALGFLLGLLMHFVIKFFKSRNNHAITIIAFTLLGVGACNMLSTISILGEKLEISNLLCCMVIGTVYVNYSKPEDQSIINRDIDFMDHWTSFLFMLFFVLSGANLSLKLNDVVNNNSITSLIPIFIIFIGYIVMRSFGKCFGAYLGCKITKQSQNVTKYLGATLLPQAGVAIGMANQISSNKTIDVNVGNTIVIVVLIATLVYELFGPLITKWALTKAGNIDTTPNALSN